MKHKLTSGSILKSLRQNKGMTSFLALTILAVVFLSLIPPQLLKRIIDNNLVAGTDNGLLRLAFLYLAVLCLIGLFDFFKGCLLTVFGQKIIKDLRMEMAGKLQRTGIAYFSGNTPGEVTSRFTNDVENVNALFTEGLVSMMIDCFKIIGIVVSIWLFSFKLGLMALALVPLIYILTRIFQKRMLSSQIENLEQLGKVNTHISESLKNMRMIKSFNREAYMENVYSKKLEDNFRTVERVNFYDSCYSPIILMIRAAVIALVVVLSSDSLNFLGISLGMVAATIELVSNLFSPIESLGMELQNIQKGVSGVRRINDFYLGPEEPPKNESITEQSIAREDIRIVRKENAGKNRRQAAEPVAGRFEKKNQGIGLSFENVSFAYAEDQTVLENLDLQIEPGSNVTFAGRTGVGKTTLFRLVMGLYRPMTGRILAGGVDVYEMPNSVKRRIFGYVEQQFAFIRGTVAEQITLGDEKISMEQVRTAVAFVNLHDCVMQMEKGYDTVVRPDADFSQGQKQLLAIARAIVTDPPILLLDEVTANLDSAAEARIFEVLREAGQGRTVLSISHRITSMLHCDEIVLMEDGHITAAGSPEDVFASHDWLGNRLFLEQSQWDD